MSKLYSHQVPYSINADRSSTTPVQFLPSTLLAWRAPRMPREGLQWPPHAACKPEAGAPKAEVQRLR